MSSFWLRCSGVLAAAVTAMDDKSRVLRVIFFLNFTEVIEDQPGLLIKVEGSAAADEEMNRSYPPSQCNLKISDWVSFHN